jgi:hypothetical protein
LFFYWILIIDNAELDVAWFYGVLSKPYFLDFRCLHCQLCTGYDVINWVVFSFKTITIFRVRAKRIGQNIVSKSGVKVVVKGIVFFWVVKKLVCFQCCYFGQVVCSSLLDWLKPVFISITFPRSWPNIEVWHFCCLTFNLKFTVYHILNFWTVEQIQI